MLARLPRLILAFDRRQYGRLRQLINDINSWAEEPAATLTSPAHEDERLP
jgi:hypothetical protein